MIQTSLSTQCQKLTEFPGWIIDDQTFFINCGPIFQGGFSVELFDNKHFLLELLSGGPGDS